MTWAPFLHLYQPANIDDFFINEAADNSYRYLTETLLSHPELRMTWNLSACLLDRLIGAGHQEIVDNIAKLIERKQVELVGSAAYHPLLPLISIEEAKRQIIEQQETLKKYFGDIKLRGFFSPEMAYSPEIARLAKSLGYEYVILDEISLKGNNLSSGVYKDADSGLFVVARSRDVSNNYVPDYLIGKSEEIGAEEELFITGNDAELYGLRHKDMDGSFEKLPGIHGFSCMLMSELIDASPDAETVRLRLSTWESSEEELNQGYPFAIWKQKGNNIHRYLWKLADLAQAALDKYKDDSNREISLWHLSRGLASCMFWWASGHDFSRHFGPIAWSPDEIERGLNDLVRSIRSIDDINSINIKIKAEKLNALIRKEIWLAHWHRQEARR